MYQKAIVTFIDILGFRDIVSKDDAPAILDKIKSIQHYAAPPKPKLKIDDLGTVPTTIQFSDSIIRVRLTDSGINSQYPFGTLFFELLELVHAQAALIEEGVLIRGGVAYGDVYIKDHVIFGPAFVQAYDLESKFANSPRIAISPDLIKELKSNHHLKAKHHDLTEEIGYINSLLKRGDDGIWFIDYCGAIKSELDTPEEYPLFLEKHKDLIVQNANRFDKFTTTTTKYLWLARYHNQSLSCTSEKECTEAGINLKDLEISEEDIAFLQELNP